MHLQQSDDVDAFQMDYICVESPVIVRLSKDLPLRPYFTLIILSVVLTFVILLPFITCFLLPGFTFFAGCMVEWLTLQYSKLQCGDCKVNQVVTTNRSQFSRYAVLHSCLTKG